jgi:hypothetical protein
VRIRYDGPRQGIALLHHSLAQFGVTVTSTTPPSEDRRPVELVVRVELEVAGDADGRRLAGDVRAALEAFAAIYHRAGLDLIEA